MLIIIGTGAVAAEITLFFNGIKGYLEYPENIQKYYRKYPFHAPVLGTIDDYKIHADDYFVPAFSDIKFRSVMIAKMHERGMRTLNLIHPSAIVSQDIYMREGNIIYPYCIVSAKVVMGDFNLLTCQSILSHDCRLGNNNVLATALLCGHVTAGDNNSFGIRSTVIPHVSIGNSNLIQAGMTITDDVKDQETVFYRHKEKLIIRS